VNPSPVLIFLTTLLAALHSRVLVNDWLGTRLAEMVGLPVPVADVVDVHPWLFEHSPELRIYWLAEAPFLHKLS